MTFEEEKIVAVQHDRMLVQSKLNKANAEIYRLECDLARAQNECVALRRDNHAIAMLVLQRHTYDDSPELRRAVDDVIEARCMAKAERGGE